MKRLATMISYLLLLMTASIHAQPMGQWIVRAPMPSKVLETTPCVLGGKLYVVGGYDSTAKLTRAVQVYTPSTNSWTMAAQLPSTMHHLGLAAANGKLYLLGGYKDSTGAPTDSVFEYTPATNTWIRRAPIPMRRGAHVALTYQNKIYLFGGIDPVNVVSPRVDIYDPITNTWSTGANMPTPREHVAGAVIDSLLYIVGGALLHTSNPSNTSIVEAYSPATNSWYTVPNMPVRRHSPTVAVVNKRMYVIGGTDSTGELSVNAEYNPVTKTWRTVAPLPVGRSHSGGGAIGDTIYVVGGSTPGGGLFGVTGRNDAFIATGLTAAIINDHTLPLQSSLGQNYPNPFNPRTRIRYEVLRAGNVSLKVFNLLGQEIQTLVDERTPAGKYEITFSGDGLPSGMYFYKLQTPEYSEMRRMVLMR